MPWQVVAREGFQGDWYDYNVDGHPQGELTCPDGWTPDWVTGTQPGILHRPEYDMDVDHARSGGACAKFFTTHASHEGVLCRPYNVLPGDLVRVTAHGAMWRTRCGHGLRVGLDGSGNTNFRRQSVQWSSWYAQYDPTWVPEEYKAMSVSVLPRADLVTVFLYSHTDYMADIAACFWDDVLLEQNSEHTPQPGTTDELLKSILTEVTDIRQLLVSMAGG